MYHVIIWSCDHMSVLFMCVCDRVCDHVCDHVCDRVSDHVCDHVGWYHVYSGSLMWSCDTRSCD